MRRGGCKRVEVMKGKKKKTKKKKGSLMRR